MCVGGVMSCACEKSNAMNAKYEFSQEDCFIGPSPNEHWLLHLFDTFLPPPRERLRGSTTPGHHEWMILSCVSYSSIFDWLFSIWSHKSNWGSIAFPPCPCTGSWQTGSWMAVDLKGNEGLSGCQGCCFVFFPSLAETPCSLSSESKATSPAREKAETGRENGSGLVWSLGYRDSWAFSWTVIHFVCPCLCVCASLCEDGYLITRIFVVGWVCNMTLQGCYLSIWVCMYVCVWEEKTEEAAVFMYACVSDPRPAVSPHCASGLWCWHKQAGADLRHPHMTAQQKEKQSACRPRRQPVAHPPNVLPESNLPVRQQDAVRLRGCCNYFQ